MLDLLRSVSQCTDLPLTFSFLLNLLLQKIEWTFSFSLLQNEFGAYLFFMYHYLKHFQFSKNGIFGKNASLFKTKIFHHGLNYQKLSEDPLKSFQYESIFPYQLKQTLSTLSTVTSTECFYYSLYQYYQNNLAWVCNSPHSYTGVNQKTKKVK